MVQVISFRISKGLLKMSVEMVSDMHIVDVATATKRAKASEEIDLNCKSVLLDRILSPELSHCRRIL